MAALLNNANVVTGDDITRTQFGGAGNLGIYTDLVLPTADDEAVTDFPFENEDFTSLRTASLAATSDADSGYLTYFSYLPSSILTPPWPNFTLLATPGALIEEGGGSSRETWGVVGE